MKKRKAAAIILCAATVLAMPACSSGQGNGQTAPALDSGTASADGAADSGAAGDSALADTAADGSGFSRTIDTIQELQPDAQVVEDGLSISRNNVPQAQSDVADWVSGLGL